MTQPLRIGTRGSPLALSQAQMVAVALAAQGQATEIVPITTTGDVVQDRPLAEIGGKALWTKELDRALLDGRTHLSVHSMKDVETIRPDSLAIAAMLPRADPRDRLIGAERIGDLRDGAVVGTSSPRRAAQLLARRPNLRVVPLRGNVQTRLARVGSGEIDATLLAAAGLDRLGIAAGAPLDDMLSAPGQGAVGIEILAEREDLRAILAMIDHEETSRCVHAERAFLAALGGDCHSAVAARAVFDGATLRLDAEILSADGREAQSGTLLVGDGAAPADLAHTLLGRASPALRAMFGR
jgi:hydroxymethylbilane synthase